VTDLLTTVDRWSMLVGVFLPLLIAAVNRQIWPGAVKLVVSALLCIVASAVTVYLTGQWNAHDVVGSLVLVATFSYASYHWAWKPSGVAPAVERATG
jgi:hypothetical protein